MSPAAVGFTAAASIPPVPAVAAEPASTSNPASRSGARGHVVAASVAAVGAGVLLASASQPRRRGALRPTRRAQRRFRLSPLAADAIAGAAGELVQIGVLYPLDTIKVICQAADCSTKDALRTLLQPGRPLWTAAPALYRGCLPAAGLSAVVGALYLVAFTGGRALVGGGSGGGARAHGHGRPAASPVASTSGRGEDDRKAVKKSGYGGPATVAAAGAAMGGAAASCLATSLIESPLEMFRHRMQAGVSGGAGLAAQALAAVRAGGPRELYRGYASFLLKSFPYDAAELVTYALLADAGGAAAAAGWAPPSVTGAVVGALAGAAAVVASMPADCVKLRLELNTAGAPPPATTRAAVGQFFSTGADIAAGGGARSLFRGLGPRLAEKVPSTAAYWLVVEATRRALAPYVDDGSADPVPA